MRALLRRPGFTAVALVTLALGIGANTAIFTVVNAVLLRPLPYPDPDELVLLLETNAEAGLDQVPASAVDYLAWRAGATRFEAMAAYANGQATLEGGVGDPQRLPAAAVRSTFFDVFKVPPLMGRGFVRGEDQRGAPAVVVLSHGLWQDRFGADPDVVGRTVQLDGAPAQVVGVMPEGFRFPGTAQLWTPLVFAQEQLDDRNWHFAPVVARLRDGATVASATEELQVLAARQEEAYPDSNAGWSAAAFPLHDELVGSSEAMLWVLLGAVGFVLLIACTNVANLLMVRAAGRRRETAIRTALGAGRGRLLGQLLVESLVLAVAGGAAGLLLAGWGLELLLALAPLTVPGGATPGIDGTVLAFTLAVSVGAGLVFGTAPAALMWREEPLTDLRDGGRGRLRGAGGRLRSALVVAEIALALVLVVGAGLMVRSLSNLMGEDVGFPSGNLLVAQVALPAERYAGPERILGFYRSLLERVEAIPGVRSAALGPWLPPASGPIFHHRVEGVHTAWTMDLPTARSRPVSAGYFETLGIPVLEGRALGPEDRAETARVAVVDAAFANAFFPGESALGRRIRVLEDEPREIVGVVGDVKNTGLAGAPQPTSYVPMTQTAWPDQGIVVRTAADPGRLVRPVTDAVHELDPGLPVFGVETMEQRLRSSVAQPRFQTRLLGLFALLALVLAAVGIYGVMAWSVAERTAEIGLRMALGASEPEVRDLVVKRALGLTLAGAALGVVGALVLTRVLSSFLFGVDARDPLTFVAVAVGLGVVALVASWLPARRASRLDPIRALSTE